ncbi:hypothetical protein BaRGS_00020110 [Batillaria attramentaria]|uniref:TOG domain-containing protein n=1 Tax=Batillaria attramentaria TaxID=370345 RepID=A0ABD0KN94_9CAEN
MDSMMRKTKERMQDTKRASLADHATVINETAYRIAVRTVSQASQLFTDAGVSWSESLEPAPQGWKLGKAHKCALDPYEGFKLTGTRAALAFAMPGLSKDIHVEPGKPPDDANKPDEDETPLPLKATLARGSSTHRGSPKVPPISSSGIYDDDADSAYSVSTNGTPHRTLRSIRNSASKKKADRLFERASEKQNSRRNSGSPTESERVEESGIFSATSTFTSVRSKKSDVVPESKPKVSSHASLAHKRSSENLDINENNPNTGMTFNPNSGVTFRENRTSDVQVVGRGYSDDSSSIYDSRSTQQANVRARDRRRMNSKGSILSPLGAPTLHPTSPLGGSGLSPEGEKGEEEKSKSIPIQDRIALVGRGMFDMSASVAEYPVSTAITDKGDRKRVEPPRATAPPGVVGVAVRSTNDMSSADSTATEDDSEDDTSSLAKSSSLKRSISMKTQLKKDLEERERLEREWEKERKQKEKEDLMRQERERQQKKLKKLSTADESNLSIEPLSISGSNSSSSSSFSNVKATPPRPAPPAVTPRKTIKTSSEPVSSYPMPATERSPDADVPAEEWKPFNDPDGALRAAQKKLENDDWEMKTEGLGMIRRLLHFHPETFAPSQLHPVILAVVNEVKNLRSQVSRLAIVCLGDMFAALKKGMDPDLDIVTRHLLAKAGESSNFIRDDVDRALSSMVEGATAQRALLALIAGGATHKNTAVRRTAAQFLVQVVERMGSGKILSGVKDVTDRVLPTAAQFAMDNSPETRYYGRKILWLLMSHQDFDRMLTKYLPANTLRSIQDVVESLKNKGLGDKPSETASARSRRSGHGSRMGSSLRGGSANSGMDGSASNTPPARRRPARTDDATMEEIKNMVNQMNANDWRQRYEAIGTFQEMCIEHPNIIAMQIVKIFDKFLPRLQDSNSKVNLHALKVMHQVVPMLKDALHSVISMAVTSVVPNLSSKNREIYSTAVDILDSFLEHLDHSMLVQPFANQAQCASGHSKAEMVEKVAYLVDRVYERKPKQVVLHVLPLLWHLLGVHGVGGGQGSGDLRSATAQLASTLHLHMGQGLMDKANSDPNITTRHLNILNELIHSH